MRGDVPAEVNLPAGWKLIRADRQVALPARKEGTARAAVAASGAGLHAVTVDIEFAGRRLREWAEALVRVEP